MSLSIRNANEADIPRIQDIAVDTGMFTNDDVGFLGDMFRSGAAEPQSEGRPRWLAACVDGIVVGAAYYAPEPFSDRMWNLYFIAVQPATQGQQVGTQLIGFIENDLRSRGDSVARTLIVETSSTAKYERTRTFYRRRGYDEEARIRQFYGPEDDKIVFWKFLQA